MSTPHVTPLAAADEPVDQLQMALKIEKGKTTDTYLQGYLCILTMDMHTRIHIYTCLCMPIYV